jgi:hypothetical protein
MSAQSLQTPNLLLRSLSEQDREMLQPMLSRCDLSREMVLHKVGERSPRCYFIEGGISSAVAIDGSSRTEVGLTGLEGVTGINVLLGDNLSPFETFIQVDGGTALSIGSDDLMKAMESSDSLRKTLLLYAIPS